MDKVDELIERMAEDALREIHQLADRARIALGWSVSKVNRSRGQKARWQRAREIKGVSK